MKIDLSAEPHRGDDLMRFLREMGHVADEVACAVIEVKPGPSLHESMGVHAFALSLHVNVWNIVNEANARIVSVSGSLEPEPPPRPRGPHAMEITGRPGGDWFAAFGLSRA
jgi:hypothetical protein